MADINIQSMENNLIDIDINNLLQENATLKEENRRLLQLVSLIHTSIRDYELDLQEYREAEKAKKEKEAIKKIVVEDHDIVGKFEININDVPLSDRVKKALINYHCKTLGDIAKMNKKDILHFNRLGMKGVTEIEEILKSQGLSFGMKVKEIIEEAKLQK